MFAAANVADIVVAVIASMGGLAGVIITSRAQNKKLDSVQKQVATSNGKTAGQYTEETFYRLDRIEMGQQLMREDFARHAVQDSMHFAEVNARLESIEGNVS